MTLYSDGFTTLIKLHQTFGRRLNFGSQEKIPDHLKMKDGVSFDERTMWKVSTKKTDLR